MSTKWTACFIHFSTFNVVFKYKIRGDVLKSRKKITPSPKMFKIIIVFIFVAVEAGFGSFSKGLVNTLKLSRSRN